MKNASPEGISKAHVSLDANCDAYGRHTLRTQIYWRLTCSPADLQTDAVRSTLLKDCFPQETEPSRLMWSPEEFYESVYSPSLNIRVAPQIQHPSLRCTLYPFQKRAVHWLLEREGVVFQDGMLGRRKVGSSGDALPPSFYHSMDAGGKPCYVSPSLGVVVQDKSSLHNFETKVRGGILAEEMGLGKTVELIALICLHERPLTFPRVFDRYTNTNVIPSGATLIITPQHILQQWKNEIEMHAPHLRVLHYKGMSSASTKQDENASLQSLLQNDVVLTTYNVLSREIHWASPPPDRNLRHAQKYERRRSPLVLISWWRVCLDEAQMIESGVSQAAMVARLIPRRNAWSVTGTPIKKDAHDLMGLLIFLRYGPFATKRVWERIDQATFKQIFGTIALRHSKDQVRHELQLPPQRRIVITTPFTAIEDQHYTQLIQEMCEGLGLNLDGSPAKDDYDPQSSNLTSDMRAWLRRLRQTCLHAHISRKNKRLLGRGDGPLRTIGEVLEGMMDANETALRTSEREVVMAQVLRAHIIAYGKNDPERYQKALHIYGDALRQADLFVLEGRRELEAERQNVRGNGEIVGIAGGAEESGGESESDGNQSEQVKKVFSLRKALRSSLEVQHVCCFFVATAYFQMKTDEERVVKDSNEYNRLEERETQYYDRAKIIRKELLREPHSKAERVMRKIAAKTKTKAWANVKMISELATFGGIESRRVLKNLGAVSALLDRQAAQIELWRKSVIQRLSKPLVDEDEGQETTGEEYEDSTKVQDELFVYSTGLRALIADRHNALTGMPNYRVDQELREALRFAKSEEGHAPKLMLEIIEERTKMKPKPEDGSLRLIVSEFRSLATKYMGDTSDRAKIEVTLVEKYLKEVQRILTQQTQILAELEKEQEVFRTAMNLRVEFYKQLQAISDTVAPYKEEMDEELDFAALTAAMAREQSCASRLAQLTTKRNYLLHLRTESTDQEDARDCVICRSSFEIGVLTVCGHQYCKDCIRQWWRSHRNCPICKRTLRMVDFHEITYKPQELRAQEEQANPMGSPSKAGSDRSSPSSASATSIYSDMSIDTVNEIKAVDLPGSYGTKIDTLSRHIIWLRENDPGAKSIIFSQFSEFLTVLADALDEFKIGHTSIHVSDGIERFRRDPSIECFLLDAKSDSSGLNLVNATHVFLCEPLINTAIELQAIARVHRIGQLRPTTVYMYLISDTVEEAIYEISVQRRLAHMGKTSSCSSSRAVSERSTPALQENMLDKANSLEMQQAPISSLLTKGKGGGEIVEKEDLWNCLFGKPRRAAEALPAEIQQDVDRQLRAEAAEGRREANPGLF